MPVCTVFVWNFFLGIFILFCKKKYSAHWIIMLFFFLSRISAICGDYYIGGRRFDSLPLLIGYYTSVSYLLKEEQLKYPVAPPEVSLNTLVSNHFHSIKKIYFRLPNHVIFDGMLGTGLPVSMYTTKTPIDKWCFNVTQLKEFFTFSVKDRYQLNYFICIKDINA